MEKCGPDVREHACAITQTATPSGNVPGQKEDTRMESLCQSSLELPY
jgi:hypothetical protein